MRQDVVDSSLFVLILQLFKVFAHLFSMNNKVLVLAVSDIPQDATVLGRVLLNVEEQRVGSGQNAEQLVAGRSG